MITFTFFEFPQRVEQIERQHLHDESLVCVKRDVFTCKEIHKRDVLSHLAQHLRADNASTRVMCIQKGPAKETSTERDA